MRLHADHVYAFALALLIAASSACQPIVETFDDVEDCQLYSQASGQPPTSDTAIAVATWNIRFGMELRPWFADACGSRVLMTEDEARSGLDTIIRGIRELNADVLMLQEVDVNSKRSNYLNQMQEILRGAGYQYAAYASNWKAQVIPSDGLGRVDEGNAVFSRYPILSATRYQLPLRGDQDALTKLFYVRECVMVVVLDVPGDINLAVVNTHLSAFATDDTKKRQLDKVLSIAESYRSSTTDVVIGGDFNLLPPNAVDLDYCDEDACPGEVFHVQGADPLHKEGSNYAPEITWMQPFYDRFVPAVTLAQEAAEPSRWYSHAVDVTTPYDRHIDHLFTSNGWVADSSRVLGEGVWRRRSDHAPFRGLLRVKVTR